MKISEAITFIINQNDKKLLTDSKRFKSYLLDLCSDHQTELKIVKRALGDKVLERIFGNERDNVKIARLRDEFDEQGMTIDWSEFVISSFAEALGWNYTPKVQNQQAQSQLQQKPKQLQNQSSNQTDWTCSCGNVNNGSFCGNCGKSKPVPKNASWTCSCGTVNKTKFCTNCGKTKQQTIQAQKQSSKQQPNQTQQSKQVQQTTYSIGNPFVNAYGGDYVKFGRYPQTANADIQPIEWLVLSRENNKMLVISRYGLEARRFDSTSNNWKNSEIRKWLNGAFYNIAFTENEKKLIRVSSIFGSLFGLGDNVSLLSKEEADKYFANNNERRCKPTGYVMKNGAYWDAYYGWWLRSPNPNISSRVYSVYFPGDIIDYWVIGVSLLVRPALWINL